MKIAMLANASVVHTQRWVEYFRGRGHDLRLWSLEAGPAHLDARTLAAPPLPAALRYPWTTPSLKRALRAFAPDLVDAHYVPNYGLLGALSGQRPLVITAWGSDLLVSPARGPLHRWRARFVLERADLVIADAEILARAARDLGAAAGRVHCVPWGIDLARFIPGAREAGLLLSTRRHEPIYDLPVILGACARVAASHPAARLVMASDGSLRGALERQAAARLPAGRYAFPGAVDLPVLAGWLGRADLYLSASRSDSTSVSLLEAMAAGAVPVVSDIPGNREWVEEGVGGCLFAAGDAEDCARAIAAALADSAWRERARSHNRALVESRADAVRNMARIEELYGQVARGARR